MSPMKRPRLDSQHNSACLTESFLSDVDAEVETDIALKRQLTSTLESRIAWALMLQASIKKGNGNASQDTFRNVALDALEVVERTSDHILCQDPIPPPSIHANQISRPAPRKSLPFDFKSKPSFLYIRSNTLVNAEGNNQNHLYLLKCPSCSRITFTSLQGLLNHARLSHSLEWGTHDECIRACAVVDNDLDVEAGIEVGVGPTGVLPGLRTIFQMAVGTPQVLREEDLVGSSPVTSAIEMQSPSLATNHLIQTLGFHEDSPALAPFLGKEAIRRQIKVLDEDCEIDLEATHELRSQRRARPWKMPFTQRNFSEGPVEALEKDRRNGENTGKDLNFEMGGINAKPEITENVVSNQSRFHFATRIIITDRSLWIPVEQRPKGYQIYSHKWMISVDSPSYTRHITSVLNSVRVTPSDPIVSIPTPPTTSNPPFVVVGFSDKPFLARIELSFSGAGSELPEQNLVFQHWVDLDPLNSGRTFDGQEQVVDVELDRNTVLKPVQIGYTLGRKYLWNQGTEPRAACKAKEDNHIPNPWQLPQISQLILNNTVKQFPMTLSAINRSQPPILPYMLVASSADFRTLVAGRQRAIEWARARAIRDAYTQEIRNSQDQYAIAMSVADVYSWLSDNGHFIREKKSMKEPHVKQMFPRIKVEKERTLPQNQEQKPHWCPICGLEAKVHSRTAAPKVEHLGDEDAKESILQSPGISALPSENGCHVVPRVLQVAKLPRVDVCRMQRSQDSRPSVHGSTHFATHHYDVSPSMIDPDLILSIRELVKDLGLSKFLPSVESSDPRKHLVPYPLEEFGKHRKDVEKNLGLFGLLALVTKQFLRVLVDSGVEVANRDKMIASSFLPTTTLQKGNRRVIEKKSETPRILTPTHILSGILTRGRGRSSLQNSFDAVVLSSLSKLGVGVDPTDFGTHGRQGETEVPVKMEE